MSSSAESAEPEKRAVEPPPKRRRRWRRRLLWLAAMLVAMIALGPMVGTSPPAVSVISSQASRMLGRKVEVSGVYFGWFTPFEVREVSIAPGEGEPADRPLLRVKDVRA